MKVHFDPTQFVRSHGRQPKGRGSWAFQVKNVDGADGDGDFHLSPSMTYSEARTWAEGQAIKEVSASRPNAAHVYVDVLP